MLRDVFDENFRLMKSLSSKHLNDDGTSLELGSGAVSIKSVLPNVITSDVVHSEFNDCRIDAMDMDISDNDLSVIYAQNVFHHIPAPEKFFSEADRVLKQGGGIILIEPFYGPLAAFIYSKFITEEIFDKKQVGWSSDHKGPMLGANQALSYIVFKRDRDIFEKKFPQFQIVETAVLPNYMRYILSGGLNFRQLIPNALAPVLFALEKIVSPLKGLFGIHYVIVIKKCN